MPLKHGSSQAVRSSNIKELRHAGFPEKQSIAIAYSQAKKHPKRAEGGIAAFSDDNPFDDHSKKSSGFINSSTAGRTDRLPVSVENDSYIVPADIVSGLGQGNSLAGARILDELLGQHEVPSKAVGGNVHGKGKVPIIVAGGEYVVHPEAVKRLGRGDLKAGHRALDRMVANVRSHTIKKLKKLPKPHK